MQIGMDRSGHRKVVQRVLACSPFRSCQASLERLGLQVARETKIFFSGPLDSFGSLLVLPDDRSVLPHSFLERQQLLGALLSLQLVRGRLPELRSLVVGVRPADGPGALPGDVHVVGACKAASNAGVVNGAAGLGHC